MKLKENNGQITHISSNEKPIEHSLLSGDIARCFMLNGDLIEIKVKAVQGKKLSGVIATANDDELLGVFVDFDLINVFGITR